MRPIWQAICLIFVSATSVWAQHYAILPTPNSPHDIGALMQDSRSRLWLGTADDVLCFDGVNFYSIRPYGFPRESVNSLAEDSAGGVWIGTQGKDISHPGGLYRYSGHHVEKILTADIRSVVTIAPGMMLVSFGLELADDFGDLYRIREEHGVWKPEQLKNAAATHLTVDRHGAALYPCPGGWCELSRQQILEWPHSGTDPHLHVLFGKSLPNRVLRDRSGCIWFRGEITANYYCGDYDAAYPNDASPPRGFPLVPDEMLSADSHKQITEAPDGSILLLDSARVVLGRPGSFRNASPRNGMPITNLNTALVARDGTIWLGCSGGLYRFMYPFQLEYWTQDNGVDSPFFVSRIGDKVLASNAGISLLDRSRAYWSPWVDPKQVGTVVHFVEGPGNSIYAASLIRGVAQIGQSGHVLAKSVVGPGGARLAQDAQGHTWLAGTGVTLVTRQDHRLLLNPQGVSDGVSLDMVYDPERKRLWACHDHEVDMLAENHWTHITPKDDLRNHICFSIAVLPNGEAWVSYGDTPEILRIGADSFGHVELNTIAASDQPAATAFLKTDRRGWLWRGSDKAREDYVATPAAAARGDWLRLDTQDGFPVPGGNQNSFSGDTDGSVWFASDNTVVHFNPANDFAEHFPVPSVYVSGLAIGSAAPVLADTLQPIPHGRSIEAVFGSLQFDRRNALRLRYRVLPDQQNWTETRDLRLALGKRKTGVHTIELQGRLLTGDWSETQRASFTVLRPAWLSWPALFLLGAGGSGAGAGLSQWRKRRRFRREAVLPDISAWRLGALSLETEDLIGTTVDGRYEIGHILAVGGFATVARARDRQEGGKLCAIKIFRYELADRAWMRHRFEQEVTALEQLSHPNIVRISGHGEVDTGAPYLVMEFIEGRSLRELLDQGPLLPRRIAAILRQAAGALAALHERSIFHRDLKPENLMIRADDDNAEQLVLIDFSIAIVKSVDETFHGISRVAGTMGYMAPEQVIGYADASTDIHALAKIVIEMLTGSRWTAIIPEGTLDMTGFVLTYFGSHPHGLTGGAIAMLAAALAFDPSRRPASANTFSIPIIRDLDGAS